MRSVLLAATGNDRRFLIVQAGHRAEIVHVALIFDRDFLAAVTWDSVLRVTTPRSELGNQSRVKDTLSSNTCVSVVLSAL